jgi:hypothetical protein
MNMSNHSKRLYLVHSQMGVERPALQAIYGRMSTNIQGALHGRRHLEAISLCELAMSHCLSVRKSWLQDGRDDNPQFASINLLISELTATPPHGVTETDQVATVLYAQVRDWYDDKCRMLPDLMMMGAGAENRQTSDPQVVSLAEKGFFLWQLMAALMEHLNAQHHQQDRVARYS